jgi:hypothetical protein
VLSRRELRLGSAACADNDFMEFGQRLVVKEAAMKSADQLRQDLERGILSLDGSRLWRRSQRLC